MFRKSMREEEKEFLLACKAGDLLKVQQLLQQDIDINMRVPFGDHSFSDRVIYSYSRFYDDYFFYTPLHLACLKGHYKVAQLLLDRDPNIIEAEAWGETPLHVACSSGHYKLVELLLDRGANIEATDKWECTPLFSACSSDHYDIVKLLLSRNANPNARCSMIYYATPLHHSVTEFFRREGSSTFSGFSFKQRKITKLLLDYKAKIDFIKLTKLIEVFTSDERVTDYLSLARWLLTCSHSASSREVRSLLENAAKRDIETQKLWNAEQVDLTNLLYWQNLSSQFALLADNSIVKTLVLQHRKFSFNETETLFGALQNNITLETLDLSYSNISNNKIFQALLIMIRNNTTLRELRLDSCQLSYHQVLSLADARKENKNSKLHLSHNLSFIADFILDSSQTSLGDDELMVVAGTLKTNTTLVKWVLANNKFTHKGVAALADALKVNHTLEALDLSYNAIGSRSIGKSGVQVLVAALESNTTLEHLNLDGCSLDSADLKSIFKFLKNRKDATPIRVDLDASVLEKLSNEEKELLRKACNPTHFFSVARKVQKLLPLYTEEEWQVLEIKLKENRVSVNKLSIDERKTWVAHEMNLCLSRYKEHFLSQQDAFMERNIRYLDALATRFMECADIISVDDDPDLTAWIDEIQQIIDSARPSKVSALNEEHDKPSSVFSLKEEDPIKVFQKAFENRMVGLYNAGSGISSRYLEPDIITPIEKIGSAAVGVISAIPHFGEIAKSGFELLHLTGNVVDEILENLEIIGKVAKVVEGVVENPLFEHGMHHLKDKVIRRIHGLTEKDKLNNLVNCFTGKSHASKIKSVSKAISHHYYDQLKTLTPIEAEMWARYAYLHVADLFMSGLISGPFEKSLSGEVLGEEAILWLSYVPTRHHAPRVKLKLDKKLMLKEHFMSPKVKFKDSQGNMHTCSIMIKDKKDKIIIKTDHYPPRWATQKEIEALNKLWNKPGSNRYCALQSETPANHVLIFDQNDLRDLTEKSLPFSTEKAPYKTKSKKIKGYKEEIEEQSKTIKKLQETNQQMEWRLKNLEDPNRIKAATKILFWYRKEKKNNEVLANLKDESHSSFVRLMMGRKNTRKS
jgi:hypothetical protein